MTFNPQEYYRSIMRMQAAMGAECNNCGASWDYDLQPNVNAFEISGQPVCDKCAEAIFEDNSQFGVGA